MSTNFTTQQRQMIEDMSQWDSLPQNVRDLLAAQIAPPSWDAIPTGTPVLVTTNYGGTTVEFIGYTSRPDSDGDVTLARRLDDDRVSDRWVTVSDMTSVTVLRPSSDADDDNHITISDGFLVLRSPAQAAPLGSGGANRAYSVPQRHMMDLGSPAARRDDAYPLVWRNGRAYGPDEAQAAYNNHNPEE